MPKQLEFLIREVETGVVWCLSEEGDYIIGSDPSCEIQLADQNISAEHARLIIKAEELMVEDLPSSQGTYLDGTKIEGQTKIRGGQKIEIGTVVLEVEEANSQDFVITFLKESIKPNNYKMGSLIAQGGMGVVLDAFDLNLERTVAMKLLSSKIEASRASILRFLRESRITGQLEHPNIVPVYEMGVNAEGIPFYTMKFVRGTTLKEILDQVAKGESEIIKKFPLPRLLTIFEKVCDAVAFAHSKGIIHRDLKPQNIMVGEYGEVLLLDWGLAKYVDDKNDSEFQARKVLQPDFSNSDTTQTMDGLVLGTPDFMAPEQLDSEAKIDTRIDIFALGGILYNILTLRTPYGDSALDCKLNDIKNASFPSPVTITANLPHCPYGKAPLSLSAVTMKAMAPKSEARYQTVEELHQDIRAYQEGFITSVEEGGIFKSLFLLIKRHQKEAILIGTGIAIIIILSALFISKQFALEKARKDALQGMLNAENRRRALEEKALAEKRREWRLIFEDDFSDPNVVNRWDVAGFWKVQDGELHVWGERSRVVRLKIPIRGDIRLEFDCHQEGKTLSDVSCFFGPWSPETDLRDLSLNSFLFAYGANNNTHNRMASYRKVVWSEKASPIVRGTRYHVLAEKIGSQFRFVVNDKQVMKADLKDDYIGTIFDRFSVGIYGWMSDCYYDNVRVYTLDLPQKSDLLDLGTDLLVRGDYSTAKTLLLEFCNSSTDPKRLEQARQGISYASAQISLEKEFPQLKAKILKEWPKAIVSLGEGGIKVTINDARIDNLNLLKDMPLSSLTCCYNHITSLEPLRGAPLTTLICSGNQIASLEPLRGMPLTFIQASDNQITSLEPLRGMPLRSLSCGFNQITSLEPLKGMPLAALVCQGNQISDLEPLKGMNMNSLNIGHNRITSLEALRGMEVSNFFANDNPLQSLEPLKGMSLTTIWCSNDQVTDLTPLQGMPLVFVYCMYNQIKSLEPLRGMPLSILQCEENEITSLEPLKGIELNFLNCSHNQVTSLEPLSGSHPSTLICLDNPITSLEPFVKSPPPSFFFNNVPDGALGKSIEFWSSGSQYSYLLHNINLLRALEGSDPKKIKTFAKVFEGHSYLYIPKSLTWTEAEIFCEKLGGHLASISSQEEHDFISSLDSAFDFAWIGLNLGQNEDHWVTGEPLKYQNFNPPKRTRGTVRFRHDGWKAEPSFDAKDFFIIEWENKTESP
jgi:serine/threonine protein kinase/Leucine-rich repeat (LRR) protein